ncbi:MAG: hypothetical protein FPO08_07985 [Geobacter sp.]|nr:MAG: hypothetical protein FPO08_07985 [Geobacter sp.]
METIISLISGGASGLIVAWLLRGWISERLQQSIRHEYSQKLENYKAELNTRLQAIQHESQLQQLRTSLFFDHQRNAFAGVLAKIAELNQMWVDKECVPDEGLRGPVPYEAYKDLRSTIYTHQLFFDNACLAAIDLLLKYYSDSFPFVDGYGQRHERDVSAAYDSVQFLQPRLAEIFQNRIGVTPTSYRAEREIALLGGIQLLNNHHFRKVGLPPTGSLKLDESDRPAEALLIAEANYDELLAKLREFESYLKEERGSFHEAALKASRYLEMLLKARD